MSCRSSNRARDVVDMQGRAPGMARNADRSVAAMGTSRAGPAGGNTRFGILSHSRLHARGFLSSPWERNAPCRAIVVAGRDMDKMANARMSGIKAGRIVDEVAITTSAIDRASSSSSRLFPPHSHCRVVLAIYSCSVIRVLDGHSRHEIGFLRCC